MGNGASPFVDMGEDAIKGGDAAVSDGIMIAAYLYDGI